MKIIRDNEKKRPALSNTFPSDQCLKVNPSPGRHGVSHA
jgi:hypothetical protein